MKKFCLLLSAIGVALASFPGFVLAKGDEDNLGKLESFARTHSGPVKRVPQGGGYAQNLKRILQRIRMPDGFKIDLFAIVPDARHMAVSRDEATVWVGTRETSVWSVTDRDMDNVADTVEEFSPGVTFDIPNGVCTSPDGMLYIVERNRVLKFPFREGSGTAAIAIVKQGELIPPDEESYSHSAAFAPSARTTSSISAWASPST